MWSVPVPDGAILRVAIPVIPTEAGVIGLIIPDTLIWRYGKKNPDAHVQTVNWTQRVRVANPGMKWLMTNAWQRVRRDGNVVAKSVWKRARLDIILAKMVHVWRVPV